MSSRKLSFRRIFFFKKPLSPRKVLFPRELLSSLLLLVPLTPSPPSTIIPFTKLLFRPELLYSSSKTCTIIVAFPINKRTVRKSNKNSKYTLLKCEEKIQESIPLLTQFSKPIQPLKVLRSKRTIKPFRKIITNM